MGYLQRDAMGTMIISYVGMIIGYLNKGLLFLLLFTTEEIGLINLLYSVGILMAQFSNFGAIYSVWKFFPFFRNSEKKHYGFLLLNVILVTIGISLMTLLLVLFRREIELFYWDKSSLFVDYYYLVLPIGFATVYFLLFENYMRGLKKNILPVFVNEFGLRILLLILLLCYWVKIISFNSFLYLFAISHFGPTLILLVYLLRKGELSVDFSSISIPKKFQKVILNFSLYNYLNSLGALVVVSVDVLMLAALKGLEATGVYTMILFLISAIQIPYRSLIRTTAPLVPIYWKEREMVAMDKLYKQVSSMSLIFALFLFSLIWINRDDFFSFLPVEYLAGVYVFFFLMIGRIIDLYFGLNGIILITSKKYKYDLYFTVLLFFLVIALNYLLIPPLGMVGAAIATAITYIIYNTARTILVYRIYKIHPLEKQQLWVIILSVLLLLIFEWLIPNIGNRYINIFVRSIVYISTFVCFLIRFHLNEDIINYIRTMMTYLKGKIK